MRSDAPRDADRPVGVLLRELGNQISTLVRQEIALAKIELGATTKSAVASAGLFGGAAVLGLGAFGAITTCFIVLIAFALPVWAATLIVAVAYGAGAFALVQAGKQKLQAAAPLVPEQTAQTVKEDIAWAKTRARSVARSN